jgi:hypothetical protein
MLKIQRLERATEIYGLTALILRFILSAKEIERSTTSILQQMQFVFKNRGAIWVIKQGYDNVGYFMAQIVDSELDKEVCLVHEVFVEKTVTSQGLVRNIDSIIGNWASQFGVDELFFFTRRNPRAFARHLSNGWKVDSVVMRRKNRVFKKSKAEVKK